MAETKKDALAAFDFFVETWGVKYDKAVECLIKDRDALLAFRRNRGRQIASSSRRLTPSVTNRAIARRLGGSNSARTEGLMQLLQAASVEALRRRRDRFKGFRLQELLRHLSIISSRRSISRSSRSRNGTVAISPADH